MSYISYLSKILGKSERIKDRSLAYAAQDIEVILKTGGRTPKDKGSLRGRIRHERLGSGKYRVILPLVYAAYQERGMRLDGSHKVKKYTTPGTGKGFLAAAVNTVGKNFPNLVRQAAKAEGF